VVEINLGPRCRTGGSTDTEDSGVAKTTGKGSLWTEKEGYKAESVELEEPDKTRGMRSSATACILELCE
jgi:hypothetical protein